MPSIELLTLLGDVILVVTILFLIGQLAKANRQIKLAVDAEKLTQEIARSTAMVNLSGNLLRLKIGILSDNAVAPLLLDRTEITPELKRQAYISLLFTFYADVYDLKEANLVSGEIYDLYINDLREVMRRKQFRIRWPQVRNGFNNSNFRVLMDRLCEAPLPSWDGLTIVRRDF